MTRFFFDIDNNGETVPDTDGTVCDDQHGAEQEAITAIAEMMKEALPDGDHHVITARVRTADGRVVFKASIRFDVESIDVGC